MIVKSLNQQIKELKKELNTYKSEEMQTYINIGKFAYNYFNGKDKFSNIFKADNLFYKAFTKHYKKYFNLLYLRYSLISEYSNKYILNKIIDNKKLEKYLFKTNTIDKAQKKQNELLTKEGIKE